MSRQVGDPMVARRKSGFYLLTAAMLIWLTAMMSIHLTIAHQQGYGLGVGDGGRVPPSIVAQAKTGREAAAIVRATSENVGDIGAADTMWRVLVSVTVLAGLVAFWFVIISHIDVF